MARDTTSTWRLRARKIIRAALAALPTTATDADRRRTIREAYPFGLREHHPYKAWLAEARLALGENPRKGQRPAPSVRVVLRDVLGQPPAGIHCGWCGGGPTATGCIVCGVARREWAAGASEAAVRLRADTHPGVAADYLEEAGFLECARLIRLELNRPKE